MHESIWYEQSLWWGHVLLVLAGCRFWLGEVIMFYRHRPLDIGRSLASHYYRPWRLLQALSVFILSDTAPYGTKKPWAFMISQLGNGLDNAEPSPTAL
jgi:hypothetical protein